MPDDIADALARTGSRLGLFQQLLWHEEAGSTNDIAMAAAASGAPEGLIVAANAQSSGRGRHGRTWASPPGAGLYVSVVLHPRHRTQPLLTIAAGTAVADGIEAATGLVASLKWPNDVYIGARKLSGILAEAGPSAQGDHVVLGFGINVRPASLPPEVAVRATSIEGELGRSVDRGLLLAECLASLARRYDTLQRGAHDDVISAWRARAARHMGQPVEWDERAGTRRGVAHDIDSSGALLVREGVRIVRIMSGEVRWLQ